MRHSFKYISSESFVRYCAQNLLPFFPNEISLLGIPKMVLIKQVMFEIDIKENKDING